NVATAGGGSVQRRGGRSGAADRFRRGVRPPRSRGPRAGSRRRSPAHGARVSAKSDDLAGLVAAADLAGAARLNGRPAALAGVDVEGDRRGRDLRFPTATLALDEGQALPPKGIYAGAAFGRRAAISIGVNPHFGGNVLRVEAHLLDFEGDLYGRRITLELWERLRDERAFASVADLVAAIADDVAATRRAVRP